MLAPNETMENKDSHIVTEEDGTKPNLERFNALGCSYLDSSCDAELVIMDELGALEKDALAFRRAVCRVLDSPTPVLGALHDKLSGWTADIAQRPDVRIITVTDETRDVLPMVLANMISSMRPAKSYAATIKEAALRPAE